jgi:hypothetical protein
MLVELMLVELGPEKLGPEELMPEELVPEELVPEELAMVNVVMVELVLVALLHGSWLRWASHTVHQSFGGVLRFVSLFAVVNLTPAMLRAVAVAAVWRG